MIQSFVSILSVFLFFAFFTIYEFSLHFFPLGFSFCSRMCIDYLDSSVLYFIGV